MTAKGLWESLLTELSKVNAPSMLLQDFNYFINKAVNQYINKRYNIYDINQQTTDDLRVLKSTAILDVQKSGSIYGEEFKAGSANLFGAYYEVYLPLDYMHLLNCICIYEVKERYKCYNQGDNVQFAAKRLTGDSWSVIINDYYNRPLPQRPYYYIHNVNTSDDLPTNPVQRYEKNNAEVPLYKAELKIDTVGTDMSSMYSRQFQENSESKELEPTSGDSNFPRKISLNNIANKSVIEKEAAVRYGNASSVRCEIRYGSDDVFELKKVFVDYIKTPQYIRLTQEQVDLTKDTSQILEFPDYVCQEIINELVLLVMENTADPRLQTNATVSQSIANPAQQQTQQPTKA